MNDSDLLAIAGRRVRLGFVGGGLDSVIGNTHLMAHRLDGLSELAAGAMSINAETANASARAQLVPGDRSYSTWREMLDKESERSDGIDAVVVITPPHLHAEISAAFLERGINVLCEKPVAANALEAAALAATATRADAIFAVSHCYTGYPMVRQARAMVRSGVLGNIRIVDGEFASGDPGLLREPDDLSKRHWHFQPGVMGKGAILGEMGSHVHNAIEFVTGARVNAVSASLDTIAERREVYDNAYLNISMTDGAVGRLWSSYVAVGSEHGMRFRIIGDEGSLTWHQETPEYLFYGQPGQAMRRLSRGMEDLEPLSLHSTRIRPGHPEGYISAFATIYREFNRGILLKLIGEDPGPALTLLPSIDDGLSTMRLVDAAVESHLAGSVRQPL